MRRCRWPALAAALAGALPPATAGAQELDAELRIAGGWDSNPLFAAEPGQRGVEVEDEPPVDPAWFGRADGSVGVAGGRIVFGEARAEVEGRVYAEDESALGSERVALEGGLRTENRRLLVALGVEGSRYDHSRTPDSSWAARTRLRTMWRPDLHWSFELAGTGGVRRYDDGEQTDATIGASAHAAARPARWLQLRAGFVVERRDSTRNDPDRLELAPTAGVEIRTEHFEGALGYTLYVRDFDVVDRDGVEHVASLDAAWLASEVFGVFLEAEVGRARGEPLALVYDRVEALGGIQLRFGSGAPVAPAVAAGDAGEIDQGPAQVARQLGRVHFRVRIPNAGSVSVVGTFNGWDERRGELDSVGDGWFERTLTVRPGHHRYHFVVDGEPQVPEGAPRYVEDDFGGRDAVLLVP